MDLEILKILLEQEFTLLNTAINAYMLWWVSSVVFCASIVAVAWHYKKEILKVKGIHLYCSLILAFFLTIVVFGIYNIFALIQVEQQIRELLSSFNLSNIAFIEFTAVKFTLGIGSTSFIIVIIAWIGIWVDIARHINNQNDLEDSAIA